jgi:Tfp pilus assembly protein PilF
VVKFSQGDFESARRQFVLAVELDDQLVEVNYNLAVLYSTPEKNDLEKARQYYERAIQLGRMKNEGLEKKIY